jgi:hypothetical protein
VTIANDYDPSRGGPPAPKIAIVTCADPRLTAIEQMLGLAAADVDMIRNFGTVIDDDATVHCLRQIIDLANRPRQSEETWCRGSAHAALKVPSARRWGGR